MLKMAKETGAESQIPEGYRWDVLKAKSGVELKKFYKGLLNHYQTGISKFQTDIIYHMQFIFTSLVEILIQMPHLYHSSILPSNR